MQYLQSSKNPYLKDSSIKLELPYSNPITFNANPHGRKGTFAMSKTIDELAQTFVVVDYEIEPNAKVDEQIKTSYLGFKTFENFIFETVATKVELMQLKPVYNIWQFERLRESPLYKYIENGLEVDGATFKTTGKCTLRIPLFLFYAERPDSFMSIRHLEDLQLTFETASAEDMGILLYDTAVPAVYKSVISLKSLTISLDQDSFNQSPTSLSLFENNTDIAIINSIKNTYNVFYEDPVVLSTGTNKHKMLLNCPFPSPVLVGFIYNNKNRVGINTYSLKTKNIETVKNRSTKTNYALYDKNVAWQESMYLMHWFNKLHNILSNTNLMTFTDSMSPTYLEITYDTLPADYTLYVFCPYVSYHSVSEKGKIGINNSDDLD